MLLVLVESSYKHLLAYAKHYFVCFYSMSWFVFIKNNHSAVVCLLPVQLHNTLKLKNYFTLVAYKSLVGLFKIKSFVAAVNKNINTK